MYTFDKYVKYKELKVETYNMFCANLNTELNNQLILFKYILDSLEYKKIDNLDTRHFMAIYKAIDSKNYEIAKKATREEKAIFSYAGLDPEERLSLLAVMMSRIKDYMIKIAVSSEEDFIATDRVAVLQKVTCMARFKFRVYVWKQRFHPVQAYGVIGIQRLYNQAAELMSKYATTSGEISVVNEALKVRYTAIDRIADEEVAGRSLADYQWITGKIYDKSNVLVGYSYEVRKPSIKEQCGYIVMYRSTATKEMVKAKVKQYPKKYPNVTLTSDNRLIIKNI